MGIVCRDAKFCASTMCVVEKHLPRTAFRPIPLPDLVTCHYKEASVVIRVMEILRKCRNLSENKVDFYFQMLEIGELKTFYYLCK